MKVGRNVPCPCGSGKKYKKCCMVANASTPTQEMKEDIHNLIGGRDFESLEELQSVLDTHNAMTNHAPSEDFHGLSADQMYRFLHLPFESPELITFPWKLTTEPDSKAAFLLSQLLAGIGEQGTKLTATGNLGRKFCQDVGARYYERYPDNHFSAKLKITSETMLEPLNTIRLTAQCAGLLRKYKGKMLLTKKCKKALAGGDLKELYPMLFQGYCQKFNWGYRDGYEEIHIIQQSFAFLLFILGKYGDTWRAATFYSDIFQNAFPIAIEDVSASPYSEPEETLQTCFILRSLNRFVDFFGLVELERTSTDPLKEQSQIRATALLDEMVQFSC